jgi:hypothetical protein
VDKQRRRIGLSMKLTAEKIEQVAKSKPISGPAKPLSKKDGRKETKKPELAKAKVEKPKVIFNTAMADALTNSTELLVTVTAANPNGELTIQTLAMPADTNANGDIFGGWLVSQMDLAAGVLAKASQADARRPLPSRIGFYQTGAGR